MRVKNFIKNILVVFIVLFSMVTGSLQVSAADYTITQTIYNYYDGTWQSLPNNVVSYTDRFGNGMKAYRYKYIEGTVEIRNAHPADFNVKQTAGGVTLNSWNTNGKTWHITEYDSDVDCATASWENYHQPKVVLKCNGNDIYTLQEDSSNFQQNGSGRNLNITCNGNIEWYSYGNTGGGRSKTAIGGRNYFKYYYEDLKPEQESGWVWNTSYIRNYYSGYQISSGYVHPSYTLNQNAWRTWAYSRTSYNGDYSAGKHVYEPISATITFNGNGATSKGSTYNDFKKTGYTLEDKMYSSSNCTGDVFYRSSPSYNKYNLDSGSNKTFYACWTANTYTIKFDANGGTGAPSSISKTYGVNKNLPSTIPSRTGYIFQGWSTNKTTAQYSAGQTLTSDLASENNATVTLYAIWKPVEYTINFDANGGSNAPSGVTKTYDKALTLPTQIPTREGYDFAGWAWKKETIVKDFVAGETIKKDFSTNQGESLTLYAVWVSRAYVTLATQDVYIKLNHDPKDAIDLALSYQNVSDINYDISKKDITIKTLVYEDGTQVDNPSEIDTSKVQTITATYAATGKDGVERTSTSKIYVYQLQTSEDADAVDEPAVIFGRFVDCDMVKYGIFYDDSIYKKKDDYSRYLQSVCEGERSVKRTETVERGD